MNVANLWSTVADNRGLLDAIEKGATAGIGIVAMDTQAGGAARPDSRLGRQLTPASQTATAQVGSASRGNHDIDNAEETISLCATRIQSGEIGRVVDRESAGLSPNTNKRRHVLVNLHDDSAVALERRVIV